MFRFLIKTWIRKREGGRVSKMDIFFLRCEQKLERGYEDEGRKKKER